MSEQSRTILKTPSVSRHAKGCRKATGNPRTAVALEGTITLEEYRNLLIKAYHDIHKDDNI